jgi:hypothetical protein
MPTAKRTVSYEVPAELAEQLDKIAALKGRDLDSGRDEIIWSTMIKIDDDYQIDVKLCNGDDDADTPWVDRVLYERNGKSFSEVRALDATDSVFGDFDIEECGVTISVRRGAPSPAPVSP